MSEKGLFHTFRRKTLGRTPQEIDIHERNLKELKKSLGAKAQDKIDNLAMRYSNEEVKHIVLAAAGKEGYNNFLAELNGLQVTIIETKSKFFEEKQNDEINDLEDIEAETALWEKELEDLVDGSEFRKLAEQYEVWGHEPVLKIEKETHGKVIRIRPAA